MACAKLRPLLIVLSLDFPYSLLSMCGTSALPSPSWPGRLTAPCRGWCGVSSTGCLNSQTPSVWTCLLLISVISVLIRSRWKIPQLCTNLSSCEVCDLPLPSRRRSLCCTSGVGCLSHPALQPLGSERGTSVQGNEALQLGLGAKTPTKRKQLLVLLVLSETCFVVLIVFLPRKPVVDTRMSEMLTSFFFFFCFCFICFTQVKVLSAGRTFALL